MGIKKISTRVKKKKKKKLPAIKSLRKKLDTVFNAYIRARDKKCIICGSKNKLQCSHFFGKQARPATRWHVANAHAMCASCHFKHHHGVEADYAIKLMEVYGVEYLIDLQRQSKLKIEFNREIYNTMISEFQIRLKNA